MKLLATATCALAGILVLGGCVAPAVTLDNVEGSWAYVDTGWTDDPEVGGRIEFFESGRFSASGIPVSLLGNEESGDHRPVEITGKWVVVAGSAHNGQHLELTIYRATIQGSQEELPVANMMLFTSGSSNDFDLYSFKDNRSELDFYTLRREG